MKKPYLLTLGIFVLLNSIGFTSERTTPLISDSLKQEAQALKEKALEAKQAYLTEALARSEEFKDGMKTVIQKATTQEAITKDKPPCLFSLESTDTTSTTTMPAGGGRCSAPSVGLPQKNETPLLRIAPDEQSAEKIDERILVFVSFSMPELSITHLCESLKDHPEVTLILRGLIDDSMEKTARYITSIKGVFEINPEQFERHDIQGVPTFVLLRKEVPVARVSGNMTLAYAKELLMKEEPHA